jgi:hypothetical protein
VVLLRKLMLLALVKVVAAYVWLVAKKRGVRS